MGKVAVVGVLGLWGSSVAELVCGGVLRLLRILISQRGVWDTHWRTAWPGSLWIGIDGLDAFWRIVDVLVGIGGCGGRRRRGIWGGLCRVEGGLSLASGHVVWGVRVRVEKRVAAASC